MQVHKWDDKEILNQFSRCKSLGEVICQLEDAAASDGEVVCEVHVNGMFLSEDDEKRLAHSALSEIHQLEVVSKRSEDLLLETIDSYLKFIPDLQSEVLKCSDELRGLDLKKGQLQLGRVLDGCRWLTDAICLLRDRLKIQTSVEEIKEKWMSVEHKYTEVIGELIVAFEAKDYVLIADLLEYDFSNSLQSWRQLLGEIQISFHK